MESLTSGKDTDLRHLSSAYEPLLHLSMGVMFSVQVRGKEE